MSTTPLENRLEKPGWQFYTACLVVFVLAALLRYQTAMGSIAYGLLWDELNTLAIAKLPLSELFEVLFQRDFHPAASHVIVHVWVGWLGDTDVHVRLLAWLLSLLGLLGSGLLAVEIASRQPSKTTHWVAFWVLFLSAFSPLLIRYTCVMTAYVVFYAAGIFSWWFLLKMQSGKHPRVYALGYAMCLLISVNCFATSLVLLGFQGVWLAREFYKKALPPGFIKRWGLAVAVAGLSLVPYVLHVIQPTHVAHHADSAKIHPLISWQEFGMLPVQFLFLGFDIDQKNWMTYWVVLLPQILTAYALLFGSFATLRRSPLFEMTLLPLCSLIVVSLVTQIPVFQLRTQLVAVVGFLIVVACFISDLWQHRSRFQALGLAVLILLLQLLAPVRNIVPNEGLRRYGEALQSAWQPGDGIIIYPGDSHLAVMRYFHPAEFGLSEQERQMTVSTGTVFNMIQRINERDFWVSGEAVLHHPDTQKALRHFLMTHRAHRVFYIGNVEWMLEELNCKPQVLALDTQGQWQPYPCVDALK